MFTRKRGVVSIREVDGPKGGKLLVLTLTCGHWLTSRTAKKQAECLACWVAESLPKRAPGPLTKAIEALDEACSLHFDCDANCPDVKDAAWEVVKIYRELNKGG
jgi:hypothetical protein